MGCHLKHGCSEDKDSNTYFCSKKYSGFKGILNYTVLVKMSSYAFSCYDDEMESHRYTAWSLVKWFDSLPSFFPHPSKVIISLKEKSCFSYWYFTIEQVVFTLRSYNCRVRCGEWKSEEMKTFCEPR